MTIKLNARYRAEVSCCQDCAISAKLRDELLNETLFRSLGHAREALAIWKTDYNTVRPHSAIGNVPPAIYAKPSGPVMQRALLPTG